MRALTLSAVVGLCLAFPPSLEAQDGSGNPNVLRQQINALQQQLQRMERSEQARRKVSELTPIESAPEPVRFNVLRAYDLHDLFADISQYPAKHPSEIDGRAELQFPETASGTELLGMGGGMGGAVGGSGGGGFMQISESATVTATGSQASLQELILAIQEATPGPWEHSSGEGGTISRIGTTLLIRTSQENHEQIERLLDLLRNTWGSIKLVSVECDWLWLTAEELRALAPPQADRAMRVVDANLLSDLREAQGREPRPAGVTAQISGYNGQTVSIQSLKQTPAVTSITPVIGSETMGYSPQVRGLDEGLIAQLRPQVSRSGRFVTIDVHSRLNSVELDAKQAYEADSTQLDRPKLQTLRLSATVRMPLGVPTLVGALPLETLPSDSESPRWLLCLILQAGVEQLHDPAEEEEDDSMEETEEMESESESDDSDPESAAEPAAESEL